MVSVCGEDDASKAIILEKMLSAAKHDKHTAPAKKGAFCKIFAIILVIGI